MGYVISKNGGYDGYSPPLLYIPDIETAKVALEFMRASGDICFELFEVPEWPKAPNISWKVEPIEPLLPDDG